MKFNEALRDPEVRRAYEEELLLGEATATIEGLVESLGISRSELAERLGVTKGRVTQLLSGENLTLRSLAGLAWALGIRFDLEPVPMDDRAGTPAEFDPPAPEWLHRLGRQQSVVIAYRDYDDPWATLGSGITYSASRILEIPGDDVAAVDCNDVELPPIAAA